MDADILATVDSSSAKLPVLAPASLSLAELGTAQLQLINLFIKLVTNEEEPLQNLSEKSVLQVWDFAPGLNLLNKEFCSLEFNTKDQFMSL